MACFRIRLFFDGPYVVRAAEVSVPRQRHPYGRWQDRILAAYAGYYNELRTHLFVDEDSPDLRPVQQQGQISARLILGGPHQEYCRI